MLVDRHLCPQPEGLGINRGFFHVLDCADMVQQAAPLLFPPHGQPPATT